MRAWRSGRGPSAAPRITALARDKLTTVRYVYRYSNVCREKRKQNQKERKTQQSYWLFASRLLPLAIIVIPTTPGIIFFHLFLCFFFI